MSKKCEDFRDWIADSINGTLPAELKEKLAGHIEGCPGCAEYEAHLRNEDRLSRQLFEGFEQDLERGQQEVIKAVGYLDTSAAEKVISFINGLINKPVVKLSLAAAVIAVVAINCVKLMGWLYALEKFMDCATITMK